ncbi:MAG: outer membrane lipoprotein-sorting protein [Marinagarivorans sp.]|nr:outer membrane lipoprotein-sorting protein [Marinagarivorans sp.]
MKKLFRYLCTAVLIGSPYAASAVSDTQASAAPDTKTLLQQSDRARGGNLPGITWEITVTSHNGKKAGEDQRLRVKATTEASVAETLEPKRSKGAKLLHVGRNMWLTKKGLSKPVPISPRQRMHGQAANGDIAATNYAGDYDAAFAGEETLNNEPCYVLDLNAKHKSATYDRIRYWIAANRGVGVKAEFYSVSGKLLKTAMFEYNNAINYEEQNIPFVSKMVIRDALTPAETTLEFGQISIQKISTFEFDLGQGR